MGKHKQVHLVEKCDEWLSTRRKKKVVKTPSSIKRASFSRPLRSIGNILLVQNSPPPKELKTHTKQSKLSNFYNRKELEEKEDNGGNKQVDSSEDFPVLICPTYRMGCDGDIDENLFLPHDGQHLIDGAGDQLTTGHNEEELPTLSKKYSPGFQKRKLLKTRAILDQVINDEEINEKEYVSTIQLSSKEENLTTSVAHPRNEDYNTDFFLDTSESSDFHEQSNISLIGKEIIGKSNKTIHSTSRMNSMDNLYKENELMQLPTIKTSGTESFSKGITLPHREIYTIDTEVELDSEITNRKRVDIEESLIVNDVETDLKVISSKNDQKISAQNFQLHSTYVEEDNSSHESEEMQISNVDFDFVSKDNTHRKIYSTKPVDCILNGSDFMSELELKVKWPVTKLDLSSDLDSLENLSDEIPTITASHVKLKQSTPDTLEPLSNHSRHSSNAGESLTNSGKFSSEFSLEFDISYMNSRSDRQHNLISTQEANRELENFSLDSQIDM